MSTSTNKKKNTVRTLQKKKQDLEKISMLTAYDYPFASILDEAGIDIILIGDSLGMVALGYETTIPVTLDEMLHHCRAVSRGVQNAFLVGDMPFMSYQTSEDEAVKNAGRLLKEGDVDAVKLEGGELRIRTIERIVGAGIPVMGHLGLTPQSVNQFGGFIAQGKSAKDALQLINDAKRLEEAGCFSVVLESIPARLADLISKELTVPTIGIGAGSGCDGQVLVTQDMLGFFDKFRPKFVKQYLHLHELILTSVRDYISDIENSSFPQKQHEFTISDSEWEDLQKYLDE